MTASAPASMTARAQRRRSPRGSRPSDSAASPVRSAFTPSGPPWNVTSSRSTRRADRVYHCGATLDVEQVVRVGIGGKPDQRDGREAISAPDAVHGNLADGTIQANSQCSERRLGRLPPGRSQIIGVIVREVHVREPCIDQPRRQHCGCTEGVAVRAGPDRNRISFQPPATFFSRAERDEAFHRTCRYRQGRLRSFRPRDHRSGWGLARRSSAWPLSGGTPSGRVVVPRLMSPTNASLTGA